ncbi:MAG: hypothetical protein Q9218_002611 [Villophora microphyllina]
MVGILRPSPLRDRDDGSPSCDEGISRTNPSDCHAALARILLDVTRKTFNGSDPNLPPLPSPWVSENVLWKVITNPADRCPVFRPPNGHLSRSKAWASLSYYQGSMWGKKRPPRLLL